MKFVTSKRMARRVSRSPLPSVARLKRALRAESFARLRAEELAAAKERTEQEFIANVSHKFLTPIAAIKGFAQTLRMGAWRNDAERDRFLKIIESNAERLDSLVNDLIALSNLAGTPSPRASNIVSQGDRHD